jgi:hypothetical protein
MNQSVTIVEHRHVLSQFGAANLQPHHTYSELSKVSSNCRELFGGDAGSEGG